MKPKVFFYVLIGLILAVVVGGATGYYYVSNLVAQQSENLKMKLADQQLADQQIASLNKLKKQYQAVQAYLPALNEALPHTKNQSEIILQIEQLARQSGMSLPGITFQGAGSSLPSATTETTKAGDVLMMPLQITMNGSYEQMQAFLQGVEKLNRYANVSDLSINSGKPKNLTFSCTINVYLKP